MKKLALAVVAVALTAVTVLAADVAGTWNVDGDVVGNPVKFREEPAEIHFESPPLGADNARVLEALGYGPAERAQLIRGDVVG